MSQLENRLNKLERAAAQAQPAVRPSELYQRLEIAYGAGRIFTDAELAELDKKDFASYWEVALEKVYGPHDEHSQKPA